MMWHRDAYPKAELNDKWSGKTEPMLWARMFCRYSQGLL